VKESIFARSPRGRPSETFSRQGDGPYQWRTTVWASASGFMTFASAGLGEAQYEALVKKSWESSAHRIELLDPGPEPFPKVDRTTPAPRPE
jgi:predicted ArsR family transcriptional regulator